MDFKERFLIWKEVPQFDSAGSEAPEKMEQVEKVETPETPESPETISRLKDKIKARADKNLSQINAVLGAPDRYTTGFLTRCTELRTEIQELVAVSEEVEENDVAVENLQTFESLLLQTVQDLELSVFGETAFEGERNVAGMMKEHLNEVSAKVDAIKTSTTPLVIENRVLEMALGTTNVPENLRSFLGVNIEHRDVLAAINESLDSKKAQLIAMDQLSEIGSDELMLATEINQGLDAFKIDDFIDPRYVEDLKVAYREIEPYYLLSEELGVSDIDTVKSAMMHPVGKAPTDLVLKIRELAKSGRLAELGIEMSFVGQADVKIFNSERQPLEFYQDMAATIRRMLVLDAKNHLSPPLDPLHRKIAEKYVKTTSPYMFVTRNFRHFRNSKGIFNLARAFKAAEMSKRDIYGEDINDDDVVELKLSRNDGAEYYQSGVAFKVEDREKQENVPDDLPKVSQNFDISEAEAMLGDNEDEV